MKDFPEEVVVRHAVEEDHPRDEEGMNVRSVVVKF